MPNLRQLYLQYVGQTSDFSLAFEVAKASGVYLYDTNRKKYFDLNSGISVSSLGHGNPQIKKAIHDQLDRHLHTMVYGEHVQQTQVKFAELLTSQLPEHYESLYYLLTGSEAIEAAMKLAKKRTNRRQIIAAKHAYHGSTQGAESLRSDEAYKQAFYPLLPAIDWISFNEEKDLALITEETAAVIIEPTQAESGVNCAKEGYLKAVQLRCEETGTLFILDEIQTGFGRTGHLFAFQKYGLKPDVICIGKAMGGGLPLAGLIASKDCLSSLMKEPALGHITTFGGHPLSCAAAHASLQFMLDAKVIESVIDKSDAFAELLRHEIVKEVRRDGLLMAVELTKRKYLKHVVSKAHELGAIIDYFLFNDRSFRLAPPLVISEDEIKKACHILQQAFDYSFRKYN